MQCSECAPANAIRRIGEAGGSRDFDAEFDAMVKGEFKEAYDKRVQGFVNYPPPKGSGLVTTR